MSDDVQQSVFSIIAREAAIDPGTVKPDVTLKQLGIQSLDAIQIIFALEDHFGILIPDNDKKLIARSVQGLVDAVVGLLTEKATAC